MVSSGVVALLLVVLVQAASAQLYGTGGACSCSCACERPAYEWGCCPGEVIEQVHYIDRVCQQPYVYPEIIPSRQCYQVPAGVDTNVRPISYQSAPICETTETRVVVPTTEMAVNEVPLCRTTCTTSKYILQIPIEETTCTSAPLCQQCIRSQESVLETTTQKTNCAQEYCTQNVITETPFVNTVCQDYQTVVNKMGVQSVVVPEIQKSCVQLPPYKCLKPVTEVETFGYEFAFPYGFEGNDYGSTIAPYVGGVGAYSIGGGLEGLSGCGGFAPYGSGGFGGYGVEGYSLLPYGSGGFGGFGFEGVAYPDVVAAGVPCGSAAIIGDFNGFGPYGPYGPYGSYGIGGPFIGGCGC